MKEQTMKRYSMHMLLVVGILALLPPVLSGAASLVQDGFELASWTVDAGGGASSGGRYDVQGSIGQPDTGSMSGAGAGGTYAVNGGFRDVPGPDKPSEHFIYLPIVVQ